MPTPNEMKIIEELRAKGGNVKAVVTVTGLSEGYVHRIKRKYPKLVQGEPLAPVEKKPPKEKAKDALAEILPPNIQGVVQLRDAVIDDLMDMVDEGQLTTKEKVKLLEILLKYESSIRQVAAPAVNVFNQDNRTQVNIENLVESMKELGVDELRALAGVDAPIIVDQN